MKARGLTETAYLNGHSLVLQPCLLITELCVLAVKGLTQAQHS